MLLGSESGRAMLETTRTVIVDEIHALAPNKRGAHLALSLGTPRGALAADELLASDSATAHKPRGKAGEILGGGRGWRRLRVGHSHCDRAWSGALRPVREAGVALSAVAAYEISSGASKNLRSCGSVCFAEGGANGEIGMSERWPGGVA